MVNLAHGQSNKFREFLTQFFLFLSRNQYLGIPKSPDAAREHTFYKELYFKVLDDIAVSWLSGSYVSFAFLLYFRFRVFCSFRRLGLIQSTRTCSVVSGKLENTYVTVGYWWSQVYQCAYQGLSCLFKQVHSRLGVTFTRSLCFQITESGT